MDRLKFTLLCLARTKISCFSGARTLCNPVDLGLVFQDRPEAHCGLPQRRGEKIRRSSRRRRRSGGGQTPSTPFFVRRERERENSRREQGRIIDELEDEQLAHSSQVVNPLNPLWLSMFSLRPSQPPHLCHTAAAVALERLVTNF